MKNIFLSIFLTLSLSINAQKKYSPTLIVLNSQETVIAPEIDSIAKTFVRVGLSKQAKKNIRRENGSFKIKSKKEIKFLKNSDITTDISYGLNFFISYKVFEYFENLLIYPANEKNNSTVSELKEISKNHNVNWVVNIKKIELYIEDGENKGKIDFQVYNQKINKILLEKQIIVGDKNPGFEFSCKSKTINCVINNSVSEMSTEILNVLGKNKNYWR